MAISFCAYNLVGSISLVSNTLDLIWWESTSEVRLAEASFFSDGTCRAARPKLQSTLPQSYTDHSLINSPPHLDPNSSSFPPRLCNRHEIMSTGKAAVAAGSKSSHWFADAAKVRTQLSSTSIWDNVWASRILFAFQTIAVPLAFWFQPLCVCIALFWYAILNTSKGTSDDY